MVYNKKVDFHSHFLSPTYYEYLKEFEDDVFATAQNWNEKDHLKLMDELGIAFAFLSVSTPNLSHAPKDVEIKMVHQINIEGSEVVKRHKERLGQFATLPLPHVDESIEEANFAISELGVDGFGLSTNYAGVYLGDQRLDSLMECLDSFHAVVMVHPAKPSVVPPNVITEVNEAVFDFFSDTTRTFLNMVMHDIFGRYPNIKWIFPHAGSFIPIISDRMEGFAMLTKNTMENPVPLDFKCDMKHVYFDVAGFSANKMINDLLLDVGIENLLYGSDAPYTPNLACIAQTGQLENISFLSDDDKSKMFSKNAVNLFPRLSEILNIPSDEKTVCYADNHLNFGEKFNRGVRFLISKAYGKFF